MATETIDIIVREDGSRTVKRNLEQIGEVAQNSVRGLRLLQNSLFVLGGAGIVSKLSSMIDTVTNFGNRLKLVTNSTQEFNAVSSEVYAIADRTRASFESTSQIYTRTALALRDLGVSQQETLQFTESLNQATVLSGASTREAGAALIQLSQGLSSNRLAGDELRSILEQLPYVADIIAKQLGVTRGELRKFGSDGKISAETVLTAFRNSRQEIADKFGKTIPTIGQALEQANTRLLAFVNSMNNSTGVGAVVAKTIQALSASINSLVAGVLAASAAFAVFKISSFIIAAQAAGVASAEFYKTIAAGNATLLTSAGIQRAKAASAVIDAQATAAQTAAELAFLTTRRQVLTENLATIAAQKAENAFTVSNGRARNALTGTFVKLSAATATQNALSRELLFTERALRLTTGELAAANTAAAASSNVLAGAQARSAAAGAVSVSFMSQLTQRLPLLGGAITLIGGAFSGLWAIILANPIGAIIAAIVAVGVAIAYFSDQVIIPGEKIVTLKDMFVASIQLIGSYIDSVLVLAWNRFSIDFAESIASIEGGIFRIKYNFQLAGDAVKSFVNDGVNLITSFWETVFFIFTNFSIAEILGAAFTAGGEAISRIWDGVVNYLSDSFDKIYSFVSSGRLVEVFSNAFTSAKESVLSIMQDMVDGVLRGIENIFKAVKAGASAILSLKNPLTAISASFTTGLEKEKSGAYKAIDGFTSAVKQRFEQNANNDTVGNLFSQGSNTYNAILNKARENAASREADLNKKGDKKPGSGAGGKGGGGDSKSFAEIVQEMTVQNELLKIGSDERERAQALLKIEEQLKRSLTETERTLVESLLKENEVLTAAAKIYDELRDPAKNYEIALQAIKGLLDSGKISQDEFNQSMLKARVTFLDTKTDAASGIERGFLKSLQSSQDMATQMEGIVTKSFDNMADSVAEFATSGKFDFKSFADSILKDMIRIAAKAAILNIFKMILPGFGGTGGATGAPLQLGTHSEGGLATKPVSFTGNGGLTSGIPAVLHPNEAVVPLSRGRSIPVDISGQSGSNVKINIYNQSGGEAKVNDRKDASGQRIVDIIVSKAKAAITEDISRGGSDINRSMEARYGLNSARGNQQ